MTPQTAPPNLALFSFFLFTFFPPSLSLITVPQSKTKGMFVFGSSVVDNGNNNFLVNPSARADYLPYGIDFPLGPTGRFSNGKNIIDVLSEKLSLPSYIPPFNDPLTKGRRIVYGVNYGSGDSGILDNTGSNVISLNQQIRNFEKVTLPELELQIGKKSIEILPDYLFVVASGGNDYSLNYFRGLVSNNVTVEEFTANLITRLSNQLKRLYNLGARKFVLFSIYGYSPSARARGPTQVQRINRAALLFNGQLKNLVDAIRPEMPGSNLVFVNSYKVLRDIIRFPSLKGFRNVNNGCCEVITISEGGTGVFCKRGGHICKNRREYVFFDGLHLTEAVDVVIANKAFTSNVQAVVYPYNVKRLSQI